MIIRYCRFGVCDREKWWNPEPDHFGGFVLYATIGYEP